ncbi:MULTISPECIES: SLAP domain-containing protein [unclassified Lactobacillus]|uniref:SLAP domain-containing protein n=1 Tax=unclassified Lactobacillus TaxID=2620435 RepID=UPI001F319E4A|nr:MULTISPECIES: SLAP domain-containing protein [unclassified Lactobacillus]
MKKNLRIVSATAAALLAVAPVAATSVAPVFADTSVTGSVTSGKVSSSDHIKAGITVLNNGAVKAGDDASKLNAKVWSTVGTPNITNAPIKIYHYVAGQTAADYVSHGSATGAAADAKPVNTLEPGVDYVAVISNMTITGLDANKTYYINDDTTGISTDNNKNLAAFGLVSRTFQVGVTTTDGVPFAKEISTGKAVTSGAIGLGNGKYSVDAVIDAIKAKYSVDTTVSANAAFSEWDDLKRDVEAGLKANNITVKADGSFDKPTAPFTVKAVLFASNNATVTFPITVDPNPLNKGDETFPKITYVFKDSNPNATNSTHTLTFYGTNNTVDVSDADFNYVSLNSGVAVSEIQKAFPTTVSGTNGTTIVPNVDISKVNTAVAGKYPVTVSATNTDGKTTSVTFMLTVGAKGATYTTVQADTDTVPVYKIDGNTVTDTKTTVKNGDKVATFGTIKVGDKSYTRINSADSDLFVETKYVDGSVKPAPTVAKKVMHNAYIYDANHKRVGSNTLAAYTTVNVYGNATKLADGSLVYKIGDNQYVMADNIDGTSRTLTHNAYVYKTSKKRADRRVLRKGSTVTTYGAPYKFKNGKSYYRIGGPAKQYVKVANF